MRKNFKINFLLLFFVIALSGSRAGAQSKSYCDSLITEGRKLTIKKDYGKSIALFTQARSIAERNRWPQQQFNANNALGITYSFMLEYGVALNYLLEAYTIALKELDTESEMTALHNIAILHFKEKNYPKAEEYYKKIYHVSKEANQHSQLAPIAYNLGILYDQMNNPAEARKYLLEALKITESKSQRLNVMIELANNDLLLGKATAARKRAQELYKGTVTSGLYDEKAFMLRIIARSYLKEGDLEQAAANANKIFSENPNLENRLKTFELLSNIYYRAGSLEMTARYKDSIIATERKLQDIRNGQLYESSKVKFEVENYKNTIRHNEEKLVAERRMFYAILAVALAGMAIVILVFRQKKLVAERNRQRIALELEKEKNDNLVLEQQIKEKESSALLEQERLKNEIEARNRKLSAKALYLSGRNLLIEEILSYLAQNPRLIKDPALSAHVSNLKSYLKEDNEWEDFVTHFEEVNNGFLNRLKALHPSLTANDMRFIAYMYMNLSVKEIASILNITLEACKKRKQRIIDKMEIPQGTSLFDYISNI